MGSIPRGVCSGMPVASVPLLSAWDTHGSSTKLYKAASTEDSSAVLLSKATNLSACTSSRLLSLSEGLQPPFIPFSSPPSSVSTFARDHILLHTQTYSFVVFTIFTQAQLPARPMAQLPARPMAHPHIHITPASPSAASAADTGNSILTSLSICLGL